MSGIARAYLVGVRPKPSACEFRNSVIRVEYLERNLKSNGGVLDQVFVACFDHRSLFETSNILMSVLHATGHFHGQDAIERGAVRCGTSSTFCDCL